MRWPCDNTFVRDLGWLGVRVDPVPVRAPELLALNDDLAVELGLDPEALRSPEGVAVLAGNAVAEGCEPIAQAYAGHQFGHLSPMLGDGRAHLLGEVVDTHGQRRDIALKGSGRTPFSRGGDGRAVMGPVLREVLVSEFMHAVGVPTTRALAAVSTGEPVLRERPLPGAVLTRVAASHLRIGTLVLVASQGSLEQLAAVVEHVRARHHPDVPPQEPMALLSAVVERQAALVAHWMSLGFIHGVMNTDNMTLSGETIDYGPCAFLDAYDPETFFSSVDTGGRYRYSAQPTMALWGLARLAECLIPLADGEADDLVTQAQERLEAFTPAYEQHALDNFRIKLGLIRVVAGDDELVEDLLRIAADESLDFTGLFRDLARLLRDEPTPTLDRVQDLPRWQAWQDRWLTRLHGEGKAPADSAEIMDETNPVHIPRNHLVEEALAAAHAGNLAPFEQLLEALRSPFVEREGWERYAEPADPDFTRGYITYCGT
ncbi:protein adenylyltransferase SelO [Janibacter sp. G349]|uniref:protein adenylyltransferase SelO n=1 Tax=Janibacter sp. G349 TaxID=3405424 RepID=UPI003B75D80C